MTAPHKAKFKPRTDLKAQITRSGLRYSSFARIHGFNVKTVYAVLDGRRRGGPEAARIITKIKEGVR